jgi:hypothetical protein
MNDFTVAHDHLVYVLFRDRYGFAPDYCGVFSSPEQAEARRDVLMQEEIDGFGYSYDYVVRPTRLNSGE